jgi:ATP-dependent DNA ligase
MIEAAAIAIEISHVLASSDSAWQSVYQHACKLGCEGIVSKRLGSHYRSGRSKMG